MQRENSADPSDPLVDSFPGIPSDFVGWSDPLSDLFFWIQYRFDLGWKYKER